MVKSFFPENKEIRLPVGRGSLGLCISLPELTLAPNYFKFNTWDLKGALDSAIKTIKGKFDNFYFVKVLHENMVLGLLHFTL